MFFNKDRLYIGLYVRGGEAKMDTGEDKYHWALLLGPKPEDKDSAGTRYHTKNALIPTGDPPTRVLGWEFEAAPIKVQSSARLLARYMVAKVRDRSRLDSILRGIPGSKKQDGWNCVYWVKDALEAAFEDDKALATHYKGDWKAMSAEVMAHIKRMLEIKRYDNDPEAAKEYGFELGTIPLWDMIEGKDLIP